MFVRITPTFPVPHMILHEYKFLATHLKSNKRLSDTLKSQEDEDMSEYVIVEK